MLGDNSDTLLYGYPYATTRRWIPLLRNAFRTSRMRSVSAVSIQMISSSSSGKALDIASTRLIAYLPIPLSRESVWHACKSTAILISRGFHFRMHQRGTDFSVSGDGFERVKNDRGCAKCVCVRFCSMKKKALITGITGQDG